MSHSYIVVFQSAWIKIIANLCKLWAINSVDETYVVLKIITILCFDPMFLKIIYLFIYLFI